MNTKKILILKIHNKYQNIFFRIYRFKKQVLNEMNLVENISHDDSTKFHRQIKSKRYAIKAVDIGKIIIVSGVV